MHMTLLGLQNMFIFIIKSLREKWIKRDTQVVEIDEKGVSMVMGVLTLRPVLFPSCCSVSCGLSSLCRCQVSRVSSETSHYVQILERFQRTEEIRHLCIKYLESTLIATVWLWSYLFASYYLKSSILFDKLNALEFCYYWYWLKTL